MKATVLADNIGEGPLAGEWGLSIYIEYENKKILLDTGASALFVENAKAMDIPLENIDFGILSHAHYDHANGMEYFFKRNRHAKFYLQKSCAENCYAYEEGRFRYIGIPKDLLTAYQDRLIYADGDAALCDGVYLVAHKRKHREKSVSGSKCIKRKTTPSFPITLTMNKASSLIRKRTRHFQLLLSCRRSRHYQ